MKRRTAAALSLLLLLVLLIALRPGRTTSPAAGVDTAPRPTLAPPPDATEAAVEETETLGTVSDADTFAGTARADAKTSIAKAPIEEFADLAALIATLSADAAMRNHVPKISEGPMSQRVVEEQRNVRVHAYLWAAKREADNDYHLMLGTKTGAPFLTAEVSGLPASGPTRSLLAIPRGQLVALLSPHLPGSTTYEHVGPRPVLVMGSLFYDVDHAPGAVGPKWAKPATAWEIHPVTGILGE